jgi:hypothetical protein
MRKYPKIHSATPASRPTRARTNPELGIALLVLCTVLFAGSTVRAATLQPATAAAWNRYLQWADQKVGREIEGTERFRVEDYLPAPEAVSVRNALQKGEIFVGRVSGVIPRNDGFSVPDGEIHHWWGAVLVPDVTLQQIVRFLQDYDHHGGRFADVEQSRVLSTNGRDFRVFMRVRRSTALVSASYNAEEDCLWRALGPKRAYSRSNATRIAEIADPGSPREREKKPGEDRGFLWRLASWWRLEQTDRGVVVEVESATLSRDIPAIVAFIPGVSSYIRSVAKDSIVSILESVRTHAPQFK